MGATPRRSVYSAIDDTWTPVAAGPLPPLSDGAAIWAGTEIVIWSRAGDRSHQAAYEPASKTWRRLAEPPIRPDGYMAAVWSGTECIFVGGSGEAPGYSGRRDVVAYDAATDSWREMPQLPERVTHPRALCHEGRLLVVARTVHALELDEDATWQSLACPPLPPGQNDAALVGSELWMPAFVRPTAPWVDQTSPMMAVDLARSADSDQRVDSIGVAAAPSRLQVAPGLADYIASSSGAVQLRLEGSTVNGFEGMRLARSAIFEVPHPEEPSDPLPSFASTVKIVDGAPGFWFDAADVEAYDGLIDQVIAVTVAALESSGADGLLTWPGGPTA